MSPDPQTTLSAAVALSGRGVHSGKSCRLTLVPAPAGSGVCFVRTDLPGAPAIPARADALVPDRQLRQTSLCARGDPEVSVQTVEHVLAVLHGLGIDNARVEMTGPEPPIWDGGAGLLARKVAAVGTRELGGTERSAFAVDKPASFSPDGAPDVGFVVWPSESLTVTYFLEYDHPFIGSQAATFRVDGETFVKEIAPARTFCLYEEIAPLLSQGLIQGGNLDTAIVIGEDGPTNTDLRWPNELARHKALDLIGDLYLVGARVRGHVLAWRTGHRHNHALVRFLGKEFPAP